jgi:hypothetical protein
MLNQDWSNLGFEELNLLSRKCRLINNCRSLINRGRNFTDRDRNNKAADHDEQFWGHRICRSKTGRREIGAG